MDLIKSVQSGSLVLANVGAETNISISSVAMNRTWIVATVQKNATTPEDALLEIWLDTSTNIKARIDDMLTGAVDITWYAIEFTLTSGIFVQRGYGQGAIAITAVNLSSSHADVYKRNNGTNLNDDDFTLANLTTTTNLQITHPDSELVRWQVVDWKGHVKVQKLTDTVGAGTGNHIVSSTFINFARVGIIGNSSATLSVDFNDMFTIDPTSNTVIQMNRYSTGVDFTILMYALEFTNPNWKVTKINVLMAIGVLTQNNAISQIDQKKTFQFSSSQLQYLGTANIADDSFAEGSYMGKFTSNTNAQYLRDGSTSEGKIKFFIIEDKSIEVNFNGNFNKNFLGGFQNG